MVVKLIIDKLIMKLIFMILDHINITDRRPNALKKKCDGININNINIRIKKII